MIYFLPDDPIGGTNTVPIEVIEGLSSVQMTTLIVDRLYGRMMRRLAGGPQRAKD